MSAKGGATLDHLVVAADVLDRGEDYIESALGVRPRRGGKHVAMGTHNSLLKLGAKTYIEVIAIDPQGAVPERPRWFGLDRASMRSVLRDGPRLIHWVARTSDIEAGSSTTPDLGPVQAMQRGAYTWRITIPADGSLPGDGLLPTLIQWADERHPADDLPESHIRLITLAGAHPSPASIRAPLAALGLAATLPVTYDARPRLAAMFRTPRGPLAL